MISSGRLDHLWMVYAGLVALLDSRDNAATKVLICVDNEEIGSLSAQGANSTLLNNLLERLTMGLGKNREEFSLIESMGIANLSSERLKDMVEKYFIL